MRPLFPILLLLICGRLTAGVPDSLAVDSTLYHEGEPDSNVVVVTASRLRTIEVEGARATTVIGREMIEESGRDDLADALLLSPGVFIRRYGGSGSLATLSLRGTAAGQTKVLIDGLPWRTSADGGGNLGNVPLGRIEGIEVIRGGDGALYGSNALGGVVNIRTGSGSERSWRASLGAGSFGERSVDLQALHPVDPLHSLHLHAGYSTAAGDYPFTFREFGETLEIRRENGDHETFNAGVGWRYEGGPGGAAISLDGFTARRGVPGGVTQGNRELTEAELSEREGSGTVRVEGRLGPILLSSAGRARLNVLRYTDPEGRFAGPTGVDNEFRRSDLLGQLRAVWIADQATAIEGVIDADYSRLVGDNLDPSVGEEVDRTRLGGMLHVTRRFDSLPVVASLTFDGGLRLDRFSDLGGRLSPSIGVVLKPTRHPIRLRGHYALNYRAPTFNEQYYLNVGNAEVGIERATSLTLGATWAPGDRLLVEGSLFRIDTRDRIVSIPQSPVSWTTLNIGRVESRGVELGIRGEFIPELLSGSVAYTRIATIDRTDGVTGGHRIPYAPDEVATASLSADLSVVRLHGALEYTSHRYTLAWNSPETALPRYGLVDLAASRRQGFGPVLLDIRLQVSNVLDQRYEVIRSYPMPGRSLRIEVRISNAGGQISDDA